MSNRAVGLGVIGCGRISRMHFEAIAELQAAGEATLVATCDVNAGVARAAAARHGAPRSYGATREILADEAVEGVLLCLPHDLHAPVAIESARAGKHILVEKPMSNTLAEADSMIEAAATAGIQLMAGQSRRFYDAIEASKRRLPEIGQPLSLVYQVAAGFAAPPTTWWSSADATGGMIIGLMGSHAVDYPSWLLDQTPYRVYCETAHANPAWEGEDEAVIVLRFRGQEGAPDPIATVHLSFNNPTGLVFNRRIIGTLGSMSLEDETELTINGELVVSGPQRPSNFTLQTCEFVAAIREDREPSVPGWQGRRVVAILEAARRSARTGLPVDLAEHAE